MLASITAAVTFVITWAKGVEVVAPLVKVSKTVLLWGGIAIAVFGVMPLYKWVTKPAPSYVTEAQFAAAQKEQIAFMRAMHAKAGQISKEIEEASALCRPAAQTRPIARPAVKKVTPQQQGLFSPLFK